MDQSPLVNEQIDAGARFLAEFMKFIPIHAAFWLKEAEDGDWNLYVASDQITDDNFDKVYEDVLRAAKNIRDVIGIGNPLARAALDVRHRHPGPVPTRFAGRVFGGMGVEGVYIYPVPTAVVGA